MKKFFVVISTSSSASITFLHAKGKILKLPKQCIGKDLYGGLKEIKDVRFIMFIFLGACLPVQFHETILEDRSGALQLPVTFTANLIFFVCLLMSLVVIYIITLVVLKYVVNKTKTF